MTQLLYPYCTVAEVQAETRNEDPTEHPLFVSSINTASRMIDEYCRRDFLPHDHTQEPLAVRSSWVAANVIYLPFPCISLTKVDVGDAMLSATEYVLERDTFTGSAKVIRAGLWQRSDTYTVGTLSPGRTFPIPQQIRLTGMFGYQLEAKNGDHLPPKRLPSEIRRACVVTAAVVSGRSTREHVGLSGHAETVTQRKIPSDVIAILDRWRLQIV